MVDDKTTSAGGWTLMTWKTSLNDQLKGWMKFIPGISGSDEVKNIEKFKGIVIYYSDRILYCPHIYNASCHHLHHLSPLY